MNIFYCADADLNAYCTLDETESKHIAVVLRKREGEEVLVFNGRGSLYAARIEAITRRQVHIQVIRQLQTAESNKAGLHLAIAPPKNMERFEWLAEKVTEIGVSQITPLLCTHSERKEFRMERIEKVLLSACKQSMQLHIPIVHPMMRFADFVSQNDETAQKYIAYCDEKSVHLKHTYTSGHSAIIMIGPEGDFSTEEILMAKERGFTPVTLGRNRLRLETAGLYAATVFNVANEL